MAFNTGNLTQKERSYLEDALQMENLCIAKCSVYASQCQDGELRNLMINMSRNKRQHADRIKQALNNQVNAQQYGYSNFQ